jgi:hypothetical protein
MVVFGLVRSNFVTGTGYTPGLNALCPFLSQISIQVTAMPQLVPLAHVEVTTGKAGACNPGIGDI